MKWLVGFVFVCLLLAGGVVAYSFHAWTSPSVAAESTVVIERGQGTRAILGTLHEQQLIPAPWKIALPFMLQGRAQSLKAGEYAFAASMSPAEVIAQIKSGKVVVHAVTVPEGFTIAQVKARLLAEPLLTGDLPVNMPEGSVFPDTWRFERGDTRAAIVGRMQARMTQELADAWEKRDPSANVNSPQEALILASIVEEETGVPAERGLVASVYLNRLKVPMRLQSDPTVAYGIAPGGMTRMLTRGDLARDHPYNTYTRDGLPPGPICNPGRASIEAVLHPVETPYLYFVATGNGGHNFSETIQGHESNVKAYRKAQRAQR